MKFRESNSSTYVRKTTNSSGNPTFCGICAKNKKSSKNVNVDENLLNCWDWSGAKECTSCRSRKTLKNEHLLAKIGVDIAENEPEVLVWNINDTCTSSVQPRWPFIMRSRSSFLKYLLRSFSRMMGLWKTWFRVSRWGYFAMNFRAIPAPSPTATTAVRITSSSSKAWLMTWGICTRRAGKLVRARSRLYRRRFLQVNTRWKALAEIYTMHSFAPFFNLKIFVKNCWNFCWFFLNFRKNCQNFAKIFLNFRQLVRARSRLYRSRFLQPNTHFAALFEIYKNIIPSHRSEFNILANFHRKVLAIFKISSKILIFFTIFIGSCTDFDGNFLGISPNSVENVEISSNF